MSFLQRAACILSLGAILLPGVAQADETPAQELTLELNTLQDTGSACRLTFVAENKIGQDIEQAVFETVIFDATGSVMLLSLFDFRELPQETLRVRQFDVPGTSCNALGQVLINGTNRCDIDGSESDACRSHLTVRSKISVELLG